MDWGWPQWIYAALMGAGIVNIISKEDESPMGRVIGVAVALFLTWVLYMGGFWT